MLKSHRLVDYEFPYPVLTSRFIDYFNINVSNEIVDFTKASNEITERHIKKLCMEYFDHEWVMVGEQSTTTHVDLVEEEAQQELTPQWNPFESLMIQRMDGILHLH